jgi:soluble P-type ATPase
LSVLICSVHVWIPDQERMMAKRAKAKTVEVNASHVAYMSHPKETAKLIEEASTCSISNK